MTVKWNTYAAVTDLVDTDVLWTIITGPADRTVTRLVALRREHAQIVLTDGTGSQALLAADGWTKITQFGANGASSSQFTADYANNRVVVVPTCEAVQVHWCCAFVAVAGINFDLGVYWNGALQPGGRAEITCPLGSNIVTVGGSTIIAATSPNLDLELYAKVDADATFAATQLTLAAIRIA